MPTRKTRDTLCSIVDPRRAKRRAGFSFAEVMFAVVILGIGFIMVAAVFPVAIQQTQATGEESTAAQAAREATNTITSLPVTIPNPIYSSSAAANTPASVSTELMFPPTVKNYVLGTGSPPLSHAVPPPAIVEPFIGAKWDAIKGSTILAADPRYAYVPLYRRESGSSQAELIVIAVATRNRAVYAPNTDAYFTASSDQVKLPSVTTTPATFKSQTAMTQIYPDMVTIANAGNGLWPQEGFYLTDDQVSYAGTTTFRSYMLGRQLAGSGVYELAGGDDMYLSNTNGWGTSGAIFDKPWSSLTVSLYPNTTLQPNIGYAQLSLAPGSVAGQIQLFTGPGAVAGDDAVPPSAVPGAFVVIGDDYPCDPASQQTAIYSLQYNTSATASLPVYTVGSLNGRIFRLGQPVPNSPGVYNLDPSNGMRPATSDNANRSPDELPNLALINEYAAAQQLPAFGSTAFTQKGLRAKVYIVGVQRVAIANGSQGLIVPSLDFAQGYVHYSGPAQDIGAFAAFFQVK